MLVVSPLYPTPPPQANQRLIYPHCNQNDTLVALIWEKKYIRLKPPPPHPPLRYSCISPPPYVLKYNYLNNHSMQIFLLFVGGESTTCLANITCLQIMVCSRTMLTYCVWLHIIMSSCVNGTALFPFLQSLLHKSEKMTDIH